MAEYTQVSLDEMDKFLRRTFRALRPKPGVEFRNVVYDLHLSPNVAIRVWTSIREGQEVVKDVGERPIKVQFVNLRTGRPLLEGKAAIVKRVKGWRDNLEDRVEELIEKYEENPSAWE
jgi:hypothetical protein